MTAALALSCRDLRWHGQPVRVTTPVPGRVWRAVAAADPTTLPFQTPAWRDCLCAGSGWQDASRLYETAGGRQLVLMLARRGAGRRLSVAASWPPGWGTGGVLAAGGVRPEEVALICADLARDPAVSISARPGFGAAAAWAGSGVDALVIPRGVHVAHFAGRSFGQFVADRVPAKARRELGRARRHLDAAGVTITSGNSPELVSELYEVYLRWIEWRATQRRMPLALARRRARRAEPYRKFTAVAERLGGDCRIWVARWEGRPVAANMSLYAGNAAIGWRAFSDRAAPARLRLYEILTLEALRDAIERGCAYLEMGESVGREDLGRIKARLGASEHAFAEYCLERVPLAAGRMAAQRLRRRAERWVVARGRPAPPPRGDNPPQPSAPGGPA